MLVLYHLWCVVFFFKQKTAYEMRISDWSSDVCSSDLEDQAQGYREMFDDLSARLCAISGYDAVSLQPNSGAQGEYAGLLAIRNYHLSRSDAGRDICLIPASAHGTNPASAQLAGMRVVVVGCDDSGNVDIDDLKAKVAPHCPQLAAI